MSNMIRRGGKGKCFELFMHFVNFEKAHKLFLSPEHTRKVKRKGKLPRLELIASQSFAFLRHPSYLVPSIAVFRLHHHLINGIML